MKQIESFSKATSTPLGYFFLNKPPIIDLPIPHFRTVTNKSPIGPSTELIDTIHAMELRQDWLREYLNEIGSEELKFVESSSSKQKPHIVASKILKALKLDDGWAKKTKNWSDAFSVLRDHIEDAGITVVANGVVGNNTHRPLSVEEFRGFVLVDRYAPLVFINASDGKAAQMFTLAHELAHVFVGGSAVFDLKELQPANDPLELFCNEVAAEFLVPEKELRAKWVSLKKADKPFELLANFFKVSAIVVARRALDLKLISKKSFFEFYNQYLIEVANFKKKQKQKPGGGDFYASQNLRIGGAFGDKVVAAVSSGKLLYTEAYRLTGLQGKSFQEFASRHGMKKTEGSK